MNNKYPILNNGFSLHLAVLDCNLFYTSPQINSENKESIYDESIYIEFKRWNLSSIMSKYLLYCDGLLTHEEICSKLKVPFSIILDNGANYLAKETNVIYFSDTPIDCKNSLSVTGSFDTYMPLHISLEVTDYCNFRCKHCYVNSSPEKLQTRSLEGTISLLDILSENGVRVIELTGGECTTHPHFREILKYASEKFKLVAIISNGYVIGENEDLAKLIGDLGNVTVQISLDGLEEYHDNFRNKKNAFKNAVKAIEYLKKYDVILRVACNVTDENIDELEELFMLCKSLKIDSFSAAPVSSFGRGVCFNCNSNTEKNELYLKLAAFLEKYKDDELFRVNYLAAENKKKEKSINCGAGWRSFAINGPSGNVRVCLLSTDIGVIGNLDKDDYADIFSKEKLDPYRLAPSPSLLLETCYNCEYKNKCAGCMIKALDICKNEYPECPWAKKYNLI